MMKKIRLTIFTFIFSFSLFINADIKNTTFAFWDQPDVELNYILPQSVDEDTKILFVIHGNSRNAEDYLKLWERLVMDKNLIVIAPKFDKNNFGNFNTLQTSTSSGRILRNKEKYLNKSISFFFNFFKTKFNLKTDNYMMYGHSAGAQFIHRYMMLSDDYRISNVVIANAGWYTFINNNKYPYGISGTPIEISKQRIDWFLSRDITLLIGEDDKGNISLNNSKGALEQGLNRNIRAKNYFSNLTKYSEKNKIPFRWRYKEIKGVSHENKKMTIIASNIILDNLDKT